MNGNWKELFERAISGEALEEAEAAELEAALEKSKGSGLFDLFSGQRSNFLTATQTHG